MTREEAIEHLKEWREVISSGHRKAVIDMAIEALKERAMTREEATQELVEWIKQMKDHGVPPYSAKYKALDIAIEALQIKSVKHGHWVESEIPNELYVCSNCGGACWSYDYERTIVKSNYCPNCGCVMTKE